MLHNRFLEPSYRPRYQTQRIIVFYFDQRFLNLYEVPAMSTLSKFTIVGDSNVRRHLSPSNSKGRPLWSSAKFISCSRLSVLSTSLESVSTDSDACVLACLPNFLSATAPGGVVSLRVQPTIKGYLSKAVSFARTRPQLQVFVSPPLYRSSPLWYRDGMPEILVTFSAEVRDISDAPLNFWVLSSFAKPHLESDGVHLDAFSGMEYLSHLFEASQELFSSSMLGSDARIDRVAEVARGLEDRVVSVEADHSRLSKCFELQSAITAEFMEFQENVRNEDFIMVQGLQRLAKLDPKAWQVQARAQVDDVLAKMGFTYKCDYVQNSTGKGKDSKILYKAKMSSVSISREIRDKFSTYFAGGRDARPSSLSGISIRNCVTPGTLARVAIMQLLGKRYRESNPGSKSQVVAFEPRPLLKLIPPSSASDTRIMTFSYIEAITKLNVSFSQVEVDGLLQRISPRLHSSLRSTLFVLNEDMIKKKVSKKKAATASSSQSEAPEASEAASGSDVEFRTPEADSGSGHRRKRPAHEVPGSCPAAKK